MHLGLSRVYSASQICEHPTSYDPHNTTKAAKIFFRDYLTELSRNSIISNDTAYYTKTYSQDSNENRSINAISCENEPSASKNDRY
jgi:hypothetical protein